MMTGERIDIMMMVVVPTQIFEEETNNLYGYCFPSLVRKFTNLTSDEYKVVLGDC